MTVKLLTRTGVRSLADTHRAGTVPPLSVTVRTVPGTVPGRVDSLLRPCVQFTLDPHPVLEQLLHQAGATRHRDTWQLPAPLRRPDPAAVTAAAALHPDTWRPGATANVPDTLGPALLEAVTDRHRDAGVDPAGKRPRRLAQQVVRVTRTGRQLRLTPTTAQPVRVAGRSLASGWPLHLTPDTALEVIHAAQKAGLVVLDGDQPDALTDLFTLTARAWALHPVPGAPAWATITAGNTAPAPPSTPVPAADAVARATKAAHPVAIHPDVARVAAATAPTPVDVPLPDGLALRDWQARFVGSYLASGPGLVNALPPGTGKTVCAAAAMLARGADNPGYRAVVLAPATLRTQWATELGRFHPSARVAVIETGTDTAAAVHGWTHHDGPVVLVCTPQMLARNPDLCGLTPDDLVVDEATFLANPDTTTSRAAWALRENARHALVLTGTPDQRGSEGTGALVSFARADRTLFADHPLSAPHPTVAGDRVGPLLHTGTAKTEKALPAAPATTVLLTPNQAELSLDVLARARIRDLLAAARPSPTALHRELTAWRLALASPRALLDSTYGLAADARANGLDAQAPGQKEEWVRQQVTDLARAGGQVLVFSDFASALTRLSTDLDVPHAVLSASLGAADRAAAVARFTAGDLPVLLVAVTGQLGLNLQTAGAVLHLDVPTTRGALRQRTARAARMGNARSTIRVDVPVLRGCGDQALLAAIQDVAGPASVSDLARALCHTTEASTAA